MSANPVQDVLWVEKFRPTKLEEVALEPATRTLIAEYIAAREIPHLLMVGPPGSGKTTVARILYKALDCRVMTLNASMERGIDTVREKIRAFASAISGARWNVIFLDEADALTADAQTALRNLIEAYAEGARFILTANLGHKIIGPIQSRCQMLTLGRPPFQERYRILASVLATEGITAEPTTILGYAEKYPDMRRMLMAAQKAWLGTARTGLPPAVEGERASGTDLFKMVLEKNWTALRRQSTDGAFDHQQALRELFWSVPDEHGKAGYLRHVFGRGVHETGFTPDPVVLFLAVCAEAMEGV